MAKYSMKKGGKEVGNAEVYAKPHTMKGKTMSTKDAMMAVSRPPDPNTLLAKQSTPGGQNVARVSMGDPARDGVKTTGIKMRGTGAATKGTMSRGPMG